MKFKNWLILFLHICVIILLTIVSQVGGIIYLISIFSIRKSNRNFKLKRVLLFTSLYLISTFIIIPKVAPYFGREKIVENKNIAAHFFITKLCNRNYVKPRLNKVLNEISKGVNSNIQIVYLDANFPFLDGFPLAPHLSHSDGKKIDISFIYEDKNGKITNEKPSVSGYGVFVEPNKNEVNQTKKCVNRGFWQYDFTKYTTFGTSGKDLQMSEKATKTLLLEIIKNKYIAKIFIEPHLKNRLQLNNSKIRFHGCRAVRHDDHIHFQIN